MKIKIRNAQVVLPNEIIQTDLIIEDHQIAAIDAASHSKVDEIVEAQGLHLLPGVIDDQVHFRDPGLTHKEDLHTASRACAKGGVTTFLEMPNTKPPAITQGGINEKLALAAGKSLVNYGFYIGATLENLSDLIAAKRTPGIKIFIGSSTGNMLVDDQAVLERIFAETTLPITAHCEDEATVCANQERFAESTNVADHSKIRDHQAAIIATQRSIDLAVRHNHRFHVLHVSTGDEVPVIREHQGLITAEVCPHHLFFNVDDYPRLGSLVQMNPSIKTAVDNQRLWQALLDGDIQVIATDHAPHTLEEKQQPYPASPSGLPAVENSLALMLNQVNLGRCTLQQLALWMCESPALVWDIVNKGKIVEGHNADLVLIDLQKEQVIENKNQETKCRWSPWHGTKLCGWAVRTWVMGREVFRDGVINDQVRGEEVLFDHSLPGYWATKANR